MDEASGCGGDREVSHHRTRRPRWNTPTPAGSCTNAWSWVHGSPLPDRLRRGELGVAAGRASLGCADSVSRAQRAWPIDRADRTANRSTHLPNWTDGSRRREQSRAVALPAPLYPPAGSHPYRHGTPRSTTTCSAQPPGSLGRACRAFTVSTAPAPLQWLEHHNTERGHTALDSDLPISRAQSPVTPSKLNRARRLSSACPDCCVQGTRARRRTRSRIGRPRNRLRRTATPQR